MCIYYILKNLDNFENNTNKKIGLNLFDKELIIIIDFGEIKLDYNTLKLILKFALNLVIII